ncbi:MAG: hypothetical protein O8C67_10770 [Candidatus Methanoperedens sp.]|nr:hypothetical protein [Candidatus Methanoperedens sp.]
MENWFILVVFIGYFVLLMLLFLVLGYHAKPKAVNQPSIEEILESRAKVFRELEKITRAKPWKGRTEKTKEIGNNRYQVSTKDQELPGPPLWKKGRRN